VDQRQRAPLRERYVGGRLESRRWYDRCLLDPPAEVTLTTTTDPIAPSLLLDLRAHLEQRPACRADEVARRFGLSQRTFQRRLRELRTSFQREVNAAHLRIAKRLMQETDNPLKWIAIESGYASLQHFSSSFRARVGLSPSAWRAGSKF
jgi:AraC-like DNA-binding protein